VGGFHARVLSSDILHKTKVPRAPIGGGGGGGGGGGPWIALRARSTSPKTHCSLDSSCKMGMSSKIWGRGGELRDRERVMLTRVADSGFANVSAE
jgi:hypothetical protein